MVIGPWDGTDDENDPAVYPKKHGNTKKSIRVPAIEPTDMTPAYEGGDAETAPKPKDVHVEVAEHTETNKDSTDFEEPEKIKKLVQILNGRDENFRCPVHRKHVTDNTLAH